MDVCGQDADLDSFFWKNNGPKDESTTQFVRRHFHSLCEAITNPVRHNYEPKQLAESINSRFEVSDFYDINEFNILSDGVALHCCLWKKKRYYSNDRRITKKEAKDVNDINSSAPLCIVYLHTNTRSLVDALEVIELAHVLDAHLVSIDLRGCGKSEGNLQGNLEPDIIHLLDWTHCLISRDTEFVMWARGMSTSPAIDIAASASTCQPNSPLTKLKCVILDSPFTGIHNMIKDGINRMETGGHITSKPFIQMLTKMVLRFITHRLEGFDLLQVKPLEIVGRCHLPCFILSADEDDYIPLSHGIEIKRAWGHPGTQFTVIQGGRHFGTRPVEIVAGQDVCSFVARHISGTASELAVTSKSDTNGRSAPPDLMLPHPATSATDSTTTVTP